MAIKNHLRPYLKILPIMAMLLPWQLSSSTAHATGSGKMKGPESSVRRSAARKGPETSAVKLVLQNGIKLFQKRFSPIDGPRCDFQPTCSSYGLRAINNHGTILGGLMTTDRLIRCNPWKRMGEVYQTLPNGKLLDPVADNVMLK